MTTICPCTSSRQYADCCGPFHQGQQAVPTAEQLMRARYSAYALHLPKFIYKTWFSELRPSFKTLREMPPQDWLGLKVLRVESGQVGDQTGVVEFSARYAEQGVFEQMHEVSEFCREQGRWVYLQAKVS